MQYFSAPMLSASFTPQGKKVRQRLENILDKKSKKKGYFLPMCALALLMAGTLVACATAKAAEVPEKEELPAFTVTMAAPVEPADVQSAELPEEPVAAQPEELPEEPFLCEPELPETEPETAVAYQSPLTERVSIAATFGERKHPISGMIFSHFGVDLAAEEGTPVLAAAHGTVTAAEYEAAYGHHVLLTHDDGSTSLYGHMQSLSVTAGQTVTAGDEVGLVGQSGFAAAPHLHFELRDAEGNPMDPTAVVS